MVNRARPFARALMVMGLVTATGQAIATNSQAYSTGPAPNWVVALRKPATATEAATQAGANAYDIVDYQIRVTRSVETYTHIARQLANPAIVEQESLFTVDVDPSSDHLTLHSLIVRRGNQVIDQLQLAKFSVLQREAGLESGLVDGRKTLHLALQDTRVGDVVEYGYTVERTDPLEDHRFSTRIATGFDSPVKQFQLRVLYPSPRTIRIDDKSGGAKPTQSQHDGWVETVWNRRDVPAANFESQTPVWLDVAPHVTFTEFSNWEDLRAWALPLYAMGNTSAALKSLIATIRAEADDSARIALALRFVQEEVRYTGIEIGPGAYRPAAPATVLARRYGDCKDKTLLLVTLLRSVGITADPALVSTRLEGGIAQQPPRPGVFNHVVARVKSGDQVYWLDGTRTGQGTQLNVLSQASYGVALVVAPSEKGLASMPRPQTNAPLVELSETYDFSGGTDKPAVANVITLYRGSEAEDMRVRARTQTAEKLTADYLNFYRKRYPGTTSKSPITYHDDPAMNEFSTHEQYLIEHAFASGSGSTLTFETAGYLISDYAHKPETVVRKTPFALRYPLEVLHTIDVKLPDEWPATPSEKRVDGPGFIYQSSMTYQAHTVTYQYRFATTRDSIEPAKATEYQQKVDEVLDDLYGNITTTDDAAPLWHGNVSWTVALVIAAALLVALLLSHFLWNWEGRPLPQARDGARVGFGGWMIPVALGTIATPAVVWQNLWEMRAYAFADTFDRLGNNMQSPWLAWALKLEILTSLAMLAALAVVGCAVAVLMFKRRQSFPRAWIWLLWTNVANTGLTIVFLTQVFGFNSETVVSTVAAGARQFLSALVWTLYMLNSQRVRATFRTTSGKTSPPLAELPAAA
jgi:transglutaminase-like putative cysteine protease